ncbi:rpo operon protein [Halosimplex rubrum]|uniref:Rpo operon protein n=1 Tax=Halosimplex rubrum TaxID=869889 RepID=A0A7D5P067_9EURY|nr:KEOPS complex subunit Pcc1 [Halosimplex rubrum]QLH77417.1 rpo operon protein [Halosimplex rubrum]
MDHEAVFDWEYPDAERARRVERAVAVEVGDIEGDRTTATLDRDGATLTVTVTAADLVALRAGCNTWLSLVSVAEDCGAAAAAD